MINNLTINFYLNATTSNVSKCSKAFADEKVYTRVFNFIYPRMTMEFLDILNVRLCRLEFISTLAVSEADCSFPSLKFKSNFLTRKLEVPFFSK